MTSQDTTGANLEQILCCQQVVDAIQHQSRRPVCGLRFADAPFSLTDSHLGGVPYLPHGQEYPMGADGQTLWLCAQINFAQMPPMKDFPREGLLQIFLSDWHFDAGFGLYSEDIAMEQRQWRILYHPTLDPSVTEAECQGKMPLPWAEGAELWRAPKRPLAMTFLPVSEEGVGHTDYRFDLLFAQELAARLPHAEAEAYLPYHLWANTPEEQELLRSIQTQSEVGGCKLGGYPRFEQDDPRVYSREAGKPLEEWDTLLFQLDDDTFTYPAGELENMDLDLNGGSLNFLIRSEDLRKRDFSQVLAQWSCS